jgi:Lrp/AsnC family transcriptional regulator for asnA, asnC and gidA
MTRRELTVDVFYARIIRMIDDLDKSLIAELAKNARQTSVQLSRNLGVSETTVRRRISRLQQDRVIASTVVPDATKLGYAIVVIIALQVDLGSIHEVERCLVDYSNIRYVADCTGSHDILVGAWFRSSQELADFVKGHLSKIPGIRRSETFIVLDIKKNEIGWLQRINR